ncbi:MAG: hypothetical protein AUJ85_08880 [Elusimicrobia bacterium CG1_02_37_114]|nr:MAG: hypothetical protein AUJ85_08880 [Elusimicrobia bacterium CG1_02_37_114]PIZ13967.1 MAG: hypothetical protein COY53_02055 [Elusimicrobia bacterium CG_4_10_14_0_8_um_filter_37_32]
MTIVKRDLTVESVPKSIMSVALPVIAGGILNTSLELVDAIFVGKLGSSALAGVAMAGMVVFFLISFIAGLSVGTVALVSRAFGARDFDKANRVAVQSFLAGIILAALLGISGFFLSENILKFLGSSGEVLSIGSIYLKILFAGIFTMFLMFIGQSIFQGTGDTLTPMKIGVLSAVLNIILDPIMIFGLFGFPRLEAPGAALATVVSRGVGGIIMLTVLLRGRHSIHINLKKLKFDFDILKRIFLIGFPGSAQMLLRSFSGIVLIKIAALFGTAAIAVYGLGGRLFHLFLLPGFGFGAAASTMVGQNLGAGKPDRANESAWTSSRYYLIYLIVLGTIVFAFSEKIVTVFNNEPEIIRLGAEYFRYIAVGSLFLSIGVVLSNALQGAGDTIYPMIITGVSLYVVQIPVAYLLAGVLGWKETGIWVVLPIGSIVNASMMAYWFMQKKWQEKKVFAPAEVPPEFPFVE